MHGKVMAMHTKIDHTHIHYVRICIYLYKHMKYSLPRWLSPDPFFDGNEGDVEGVTAKVVDEDVLLM